MIKLLKSPQVFIKQAFESVKRFPVTVAAGIALSIIGWWAIKLGVERGEVNTDKSYYDMMERVLLRAGMIASLALPLTFTAHLMGRNRLSIGKYVPMVMVLSILIGVYNDFNGYFDGMYSEDRVWLRYWGYSLIFHLLAAVLPIINKRNSNAVWQYNQTLFIRSFTTALYCGVLFLGLAGALLALDQLFGVQVKGHYYAYLWFGLLGIGGTLIFVSGVPENIQQLDDKEDFPKPLKAFSQYVLLPLVLIYLVILYAYSGQILIKWQLPVGWVSNMILSFSVAGMLALLLLYPFGAKDKWIHTYTRGYYIALLPLLILLYIAAGIRIQEYGFTILRYSLLGLSVWLTFISIFMIVTKNRYIYLIPISLAAVAAVVWFLPGANAWAVSQRSQTNRLQNQLKEIGIIKNNQLQKDVILSDSISSAIFEDVDYLFQNHGVTGLEPMLKIPAPSILKKFKSDTYRDYNQGLYWAAKDWLRDTLKTYGIYEYGRSVYYDGEAPIEAPVEAATMADTVSVTTGTGPVSAAVPLKSNSKIYLRNNINSNEYIVPTGNWKKMVSINQSESLIPFFTCENSSPKYGTQFESFDFTYDAGFDTLQINYGSFSDQYLFYSALQKTFPQISKLKGNSNKTEGFNWSDKGLRIEGKRSLLIINKLHMVYCEKRKRFVPNSFSGVMWMK